MNSLPNKAKIILGFYLLVVVYWAIMYFGDFRDTQISYFYQFVFGLIPLLGGISGLFNAKKWGGFGSKLGRSLTLISIGIISWGLGQMVWSFYTIFGIDSIPYPSFADLGYITAVPFWLAGMVYLSKATGAKYGLRKAVSKVLVVVVPLVIAAMSYYLLIVVARGGAIFPEIETSVVFAKVILDIGYPMGDVLILTVSLLVFGLSAGYLGGRYKYPIYALLFGFVVMYFADFSFSYTTNAETYYNGHWVDLLFPSAMALLAFGVNAIVPPRATQTAAATQPTPTIPVIPLEQERGPSQVSVTPTDSASVTSLGINSTPTTSNATSSVPPIPPVTQSTPQSDTISTRPSGLSTPPSNEENQNAAQ
jgi:hypothetical protein